MLLATLAVQLLLGMWVNLWVQIPVHHAGARAADYFAGVGQVIAWALGSGAIVLRLHVALGLLLVAGGLAVLLLSIRARERGWVWVGAIGLTALLGAAFNGASFLIFDQRFSSYLMTVAFVVASVSYGAGIYGLR